MHYRQPKDSSWALSALGVCFCGSEDDGDEKKAEMVERI